MRRPAAAALLFLAPVAHAADCPTASTTRSLQSSLDAAEAAFGRADVDAFGEAMGQVRGSVPCLGEKVPAPMAAQLHRLEGLAAFVDQQSSRAEQAFAAARRIEPTYTFPSAVVPPANPVLELYGARDAGGPQEALPPPPAGETWLDGRAATARPTTQPGLLQVVLEGRPSSSTYLWPDDPLPYATSARPQRSGGGGGSVAVQATRYGGIGLAAVGLGTLVGGLVTGPSPDDTLDQAFAKASRDDALTGVGGALVALGGAGIGISFVLPSGGR